MHLQLVSWILKIEQYNIELETKKAAGWIKSDYIGKNLKVKDAGLEI